MFFTDVAGKKKYGNAPGGKRSRLQGAGVFPTAPPARDRRVKAGAATLGILQGMSLTQAPREQNSSPYERGAGGCENSVFKGGAERDDGGGP